MIPTYVVDSFTDQPFAGNPAAVCVLAEAAPDAWMQSMAAEMNLSETAFVWARREGGWNLRWFTPVREVDLCGHATLATAHVLWTKGHATGPLAFETASGKLSCKRDGETIWMDFPAAPAAAADAPVGLFEALGIAPVPVMLAANGNYHIVLERAHDVSSLAPDFVRLLNVSGEHGYIVSAPDDTGDVVCRYFVPAWGINEDPVTGSIQCTLGPYWVERLGKAELLVRQASARGGLLRVRPEGDRVFIGGQAVTVLEGAVANP